MPAVLEGYHGEGYNECQRMLHQREPDTYKEATLSVEWLGPALGEKIDPSESVRTFYRKALIDGETIRVGSYILIRPELDEDGVKQEPQPRQRQQRPRQQKDTDASKSNDLDDGCGSNVGQNAVMEVDRSIPDNGHGGDGDMSKDIAFGKDGPGGDLTRNRDTQRTGSGDDEETLRGTDDENKGRQAWFGQVMYLYEEDGEQRAHVRYFSQGWQTVLMEQASWQELFILDNCDEVDLDAVMGTFQLRRIGSTAELTENDTYFYRCWYDPKFCVFEDATEHERDEPGETRRLDKCICCMSKERKTNLVNKKQNQFHKNDFVYFVDSWRSQMAGRQAAPKPFNIGQIISLGNSAKTTVSIRLLLRHDDFHDIHPRITGDENRPQQDIFKDCRRLVLTDIILEKPLDHLEEKCQVLYFPEPNAAVTENGMDQARLCADGQEVKDRDSLKDQPDNYWFKDYYFTSQLPGSSESSPKQPLRQKPRLDSLRNSRERLCQIHNGREIEFDGACHLVNMPKSCLICDKRRMQRQAIRSRLFKTQSKLAAMDLFSGCGGMTLGLDRCGMIETKYAVEYDEGASKTFRHNLPEVKMYNNDAGSLLKQAIEEHGGNGGMTTGRDEDRIAPLKQRIPAVGEVDLIYCGPPCQGFTIATGKSNRSDSKNSLVATAMSYVDFYRPRYLLLENVKGFTHVGDARQAHKKVFVKFVIRSLTELGYQCRFGMLQAGHYGVPQSRYRFFLWAAKIGYTLPTFPPPMTVFATDNSVAFNPPTDLEYNDHKIFDYLGLRKYHAPDPRVTVRDTLSDLPGFEYPHYECFDEKSKKCKEIKKGVFMQVDPFNDRSKIGFEEKDEREAARLSERNKRRLERLTTYRTDAQCEYQRKLRFMVTSQHRVRNHVTDRAGCLRTIARIFKCPMKSHRPLGEKAPKNGSERRLDFEGFFGTVTGSNQIERSSNLIQYRATTVRERARAQGFPDLFVFPRQPKEKWRKQIGNAVPPPLAEALGRMLVEAMIQDLRLEEEEEMGEP
ncbi:hypothetical protein BGW39_005083 [Mortierella sp. 14UC]|nr:hypothetical protein BGW39_005083 [Mortierella sp. 14UC]